MNFNITGKLTNSGGGAVVPIGTVLDFAGTNPPQYYLLCNGQEVSRTGYAELFDVIGTTWGAGDGSTTFNVPNSQGRVSMGVGTNTDKNGHSGTWVLGDIGGEYNHKLTVNEMPSHTHNSKYRREFNYTAMGSYTHALASTATSGYEASEQSTNTYSGGNGFHNNIQPFITYNKIIRAK